MQTPKIDSHQIFQLFQHNNGPKSSGCSLTPVGIEEIRPATCADIGDFNVLLSDPRVQKLLAAYLPQIEVVCVDHKFLEAFWKYLFMPDEFGATGAERWPDACQKVVSPATKIIFHPTDDLSKDVLDISPPTTMDVGDDSFLGIKYDNSLAVGLLHKDGEVRCICDDGVCERGSYLTAGVPRSNNKNVIPMGLFHVDEMFGPKGVFDNRKICAHMVWEISHVITGIQTVVGRVAHAAMSGKNRMYEFWMTGKARVAEIGDRRTDTEKAGWARDAVH